ncbi:hypothetical protein ACOME3_006531 [Neoechinorhynchus agilis]
MAADAFGILLQQTKEDSASDSHGTNSVFLEFLTKGQDVIEESLIDSRSEVDKAIQTTCKKLIEIWKVDCRCADDISSNENAFSQAFYAVKEFVPLLKSTLNLYLADERLERVLFRPIGNMIIDKFEKATFEMDGNADGSYLKQIRQIVDSPENTVE